MKIIPSLRKSSASFLLAAIAALAMVAPQNLHAQTRYALLGQAGGNVYLVDALGNTSLYHNLGVTGVNGMAYSASTQEVFFTYGASGLMLAKFNVAIPNAPGPIVDVLDLATLGLTNAVNGADILGNRYYYIENNTDDLRFYDISNGTSGIEATLNNGVLANSQWRLGDIAFNSSSSRLIINGDDFSNGSPQDRLARYDTTGFPSGPVEDLNPLTYVTPPTGSFFGITNDNSTNIFYGYRGNGLGQGQFYSFNPITGAEVAIGGLNSVFGLAGDMTEMFFTVPEPSSMLSLMLGSTLLLLKRRRNAC